MTTLKQIRQDAGVNAEELAYLAKVSLATISRIERGMPVRRLTAGKVLHALSQRTGQQITLENVEGLQLIDESEEPAVA